MLTPPPRAFQDYYPDETAHCYGCGRANTKGHQIKTYWDGDETITRFTPLPDHIAVPGFVYGGLLASLIDCHSTGTAAAAAYRAESRAMDSLPALRFVTGSLKLTYLKPTPLGPELLIRGRIISQSPRKITIHSSILVNGIETVQGEVTAVRMPDNFAPPPTPHTPS